jgi:hypothetical protein
MGNAGDWKGKSLFLFALERQERRSRTDEVMSSIALHALDWIGAFLDIPNDSKKK